MLDVNIEYRKEGAHMQRKESFVAFVLLEKPDET